MILDSSALLAYLQREPGHERVRKALLEGAAISAVNLAEAHGRIAARGLDPREIGLRLSAIGLAVEPFLEQDAETAGRLYPETRQSGLSLGDRACLALALRLGLPALTADRSWRSLDVGVEVQLVR